MGASLRTVLSLGAALGIAACGSGPPVGEAAPIRASVGTAPPTRPSPQAPSLGAATPIVSAAALRGFEPKDILATLGKPGLLRRDPPAEVWQYHGVGCIADLFLYQEGGSLRVAYVQVRPLGNAATGRVDETACLSSLAHPKPVTREDDTRPAL